MKTILSIMLILIGTASAQAADPNVPPAPKTWAVVVSGINRDPDEQQSKAKTVLRLKLHLLQQLEIPKSNLFLMTSKDSLAYQPDMTEATSENITELLKKLSASVGPQDTFIFYYVGQANIVKDTLRLNLPGADMEHHLLADLLNVIKAQRSLVVLDCPAAGVTIESLRQPGRIIIAGAQANQPFSTRFSQYFVPAMSDEQADYDQDGMITILEAFRYAAMQIDDYYQGHDLIKTENSLLEDDGDGVPSQQPWTQEKNKDGRLAGQWVIYEL